MREVTSAGILIKSDDKVLLCHSTGSPKGKGWGLPKGRLDDGESASQAAVRETQEECGLNIPESKITFLTSVNYRSKDEHGPVKKELKIFIHNGDSSLQSEKLTCSTYFTPNYIKNSNVKVPECDDFKWVTVDEAKSLAMKSIKSIFDLL